jgi:hypothetical protein
MTSKNALLLWTLFWILLVTLCSVFFWDRYNTEIATVDLTTQKIGQTTPKTEGEKRFVEAVPIRTVAESNLSKITAAPSLKRHTTLPQPQAPKPKERERAQSTPPSAAVSAQPDRTKNAAQRRQPAQAPEKSTDINRIPEIAAASRPLTVKKPAQKPEKEEPTVRKKSKRDKIIIEPVTMAKMLTVSRSGALFRLDKPFLRDIAAQLRADKRLHVVLKGAAATAVTKRYMQHIRDYLIAHHISAERIELIGAPRHTEAIELTDQQSDRIELQLIERK